MKNSNSSKELRTGSLKTTRVKVCHLSSAHDWNDGRIFQKQAKSLARMGFDVALIAPCDKSAVVDGVRIVAFPKTTNKLRRIFITDPHLFISALREYAVIYHFHDPELIPVGLMLKLCGKKVIYDVHEDYEKTVLDAQWIPRGLRHFVSAIWGGFERFLGRFFDAIVVVDSHIGSKFTPHKTVMITNVPPLMFSRTEPKPERKKTFEIVYIGGISEVRGLIKVVEALQHLKNKDIQLHIIGAVDDVRFQQVFATDARIICHGRLPWMQARMAMESCDVGLMLFQPTEQHMYFTGEGNTKLFEFMGLGIPVLYSDLPNLRRFMETIGSGLAVDPTSPVKIAATIDRLNADPEYCRILGEIGRKAVRERFHWEMEENILLALYTRILGHRRQPIGSAL